MDCSSPSAHIYKTVCQRSALLKDKVAAQQHAHIHGSRFVPRALLLVHLHSFLEWNISPRRPTLFSVLLCGSQRILHLTAQQVHWVVSELLFGVTFPGHMVGPSDGWMWVSCDFRHSIELSFYVFAPFCFTSLFEGLITGIYIQNPFPIFCMYLLFIHLLKISLLCGLF